jgi:hypothetical protein
VLDLKFYVVCLLACDINYLELYFINLNITSLNMRVKCHSSQLMTAFCTLLSMLNKASVINYQKRHGVLYRTMCLWLARELEQV